MINRRTLKRTWFLPALFLIASCDLEIEESDRVFTDEEVGVFGGVSNVSTSVDDLYGSLNGQMGDQANFFALNEVTTDELLVPTRGTDWGDNGIWRTLHAHTFGPSHQFIFNVWNQFNQNVFRATEIIEPVSTNGRTPELIAEARFVRAFSMWIIMDHFGVAPFRGVDDGPDVNPTVMTRTEALQFILDDLEAAIPDLPSRGPSAENNRASRAAGNMLLAKILINAHIYDGSGSPSNANMQEVIDAVNAIETEGYTLQTGFFEIFEESVDNETIWFLETSVGNRIWNGMNYNMITPDNTGGGWNGFSTLAEFYDLFEGDPNENPEGGSQEERRGFVPTGGLPLAQVPGGRDEDEDGFADGSNFGFGFLIGQQYDVDGTPLNDRPGNPLNFVRDYPGLNGNNERTGVRMLKYNPRFGSFTNHEIIFRFADAHLLRAEAMLRMGVDATGTVNELRAIRNASPIGAVSEQDLIDERGRELYMEFWRRNDLIRFGQFVREWEFKDPSAIDNPDRQLFPIPQNALLSNPNLVQNPGY